MAPLTRVEMGLPPLRREIRIRDQETVTLLERRKDGSIWATGIAYKKPLYEPLQPVLVVRQSAWGLGVRDVIDREGMIQSVHEYRKGWMYTVTVGRRNQVTIYEDELIPLCRSCESQHVSHRFEGLLYCSDHAMTAYARSALLKATDQPVRV